MKIDFKMAKATKCLCIVIIGTVTVALSCASDTHQISSAASVKPTPFPDKKVNSVVEATYQITENRDLTDFTLIDVNVFSGPVTRSQLLKYVDAITKQVKPEKDFVIWFYNNTSGKTFGLYDYRKRNQDSKGLTIGDAPPPVR